MWGRQLGVKASLGSIPSTNSNNNNHHLESRKKENTDHTSLQPEGKHRAKQSQDPDQRGGQGHGISTRQQGASPQAAPVAMHSLVSQILGPCSEACQPT